MEAQVPRNSLERHSFFRTAKNRFKLEKAEQRAQYRFLKMQYGLKKQEYALNKKLTGLRVRWKEPNLGPLERRSRVDQLTAPQSQELQRMKQDLQAKKRETKENVSRFHRIFKNDKKVLKGKIVDTNKGGTATTSAASGISPSTIQPTAPVYSI